ncbi:hypothetical protein H0W32_02705 [Patescibacteria group bacterium]|nr:hypothetical protein [Patescibacteria group bacterium]
MAEEKKDFKKDDEDKKDGDKKGEVIFPVSGGAIIIFMILLMAFVARYNASVQDGGQGFQRLFTLEYILSITPEYIKDIVRDLSFSYVILANILSLFFLLGLVYALIKMLEVEKKWYKQIYPGNPIPQEDHPKNSKWELVLQHISTDNPSDWRLAILEADIILDNLLEQLGYIGDTIGDKLKKAVKADFETLDKAWEAHKIRNAIAHEGQDFTLTQREAERIIGLYQAVFNEFDYI